MRGSPVAFAVLSIACAAANQRTEPTTRRVVVHLAGSEELPTNHEGVVLDRIEGSPTTAPCQRACAPLGASSEHLTSCLQARASRELSERFQDPAFIICKFERN